jgi:hypothetical protein
MGWRDRFSLREFAAREMSSAPLAKTLTRESFGVRSLDATHLPPNDDQNHRHS